MTAWAGFWPARWNRLHLVTAMNRLTSPPFCSSARADSAGTAARKRAQPLPSPLTLGDVIRIAGEIPQDEIQAAGRAHTSE